MICSGSSGSCSSESHTFDKTIITVVRCHNMAEAAQMIPNASKMR